MGIIEQRPAAEVRGRWLEGLEAAGDEPADVVARVLATDEALAPVAAPTPTASCPATSSTTTATSSATSAAGRRWFDVGLDDAAIADPVLRARETLADHGSHITSARVDAGLVEARLERRLPDGPVTLRRCATALRRPRTEEVGHIEPEVGHRRRVDPAWQWRLDGSAPAGG